MYDCALIRLDLGETAGWALVRRDRLPEYGARLEIDGRCWQVSEAWYFSFDGIAGSVTCNPG